MPALRRTLLQGIEQGGPLPPIMLLQQDMRLFFGLCMRTSLPSASSTGTQSSEFRACMCITLHQLAIQAACVSLAGYMWLRWR